MDQSKLVKYSLGTVVEDPEFGSKIVKIWPIEIIPSMDGDIDGEEVEYINDGIDSDGVKFEVKTLSTEWLECEWIGGSNRQTPPNVRAQENVIIYRYADADHFYWDELGRHNHLRRGERIVWKFSDIPESDLETPSTTENGWTVELDTVTGKLHLITSKANGEQFIYSILLNAGESFFAVEDDVGNRIKLDSLNTLIELINKDGTLLHLDKKDIKAYAPDSIYAKAVNTIDFECKDFILKAAESIEMVTKSTKLTSEDIISMTTKAYSLKTDTWDVECSTGTIKGPITFIDTVVINGVTTLAGGMAVPAGGGSSAEIGAPLTITSDVEATNIHVSGSVTDNAGGVLHKP